MTTDTSTTQEQWVLAYDDGKLLMLSLKHLRAVRVDLSRGYARTDNDIRDALADPANVLLVEGYPGVVAAAKAADKKSYRGIDSNGPIILIPWDEWVALLAALSLVHPAKGGKE